MEEETPVEKPTENNTAYCSICLETEDLHTRRVTLPCQHVFHMHCIEEYLDYKGEDEETLECPICRANMSTLMLHSVFEVAHSPAHISKDIRIIVRNAPAHAPSIDETIQANDQLVNHQQGCRKADFFIIALLLIGLTIYLLALYKVI